MLLENITIGKTTNCGPNEKIFQSVTSEKVVQRSCSVYILGKLTRQSHDPIECS